MSCLLSSDRGSSYELGELRENPTSYRCHIAITKDDSGVFSVEVLNLPGAGSCGPSEEVAVARTREAVSGAIEEFRSSGKSIPWLTPGKYEIPEGAKQKWILVDA